jgi:hypothetical protein
MQLLLLLLLLLLLRLLPCLGFVATAHFFSEVVLPGEAWKRANQKSKGSSRRIYTRCVGRFTPLTRLYIYTCCHLANRSVNQNGCWNNPFLDHVQPGNYRFSICFVNLLEGTLWQTNMTSENHVSMWVPADHRTKWAMVSSSQTELPY